MNKVKFAVIGQGHIGKRHAEMVRRNNDCQLVAVCDVLEKDKLGLTDLDVPSTTTTLKCWLHIRKLRS